MAQAPTGTRDGTPTGDLRALANEFASDLRLENKSPNTVSTYLQALDLLDRFLAAQDMPRSVTAIRREHVDAFTRDQLARLKPASAANRYRSLRQFFRWLVDEEIVEVSP